MAIPFPKRSEGTARARPSSTSGAKVPVYPANDRYYGGQGSPKARPASRNIFTPNQFQAPAISYGRPLPTSTQYVRPYVTPPALLETALSGVARAARGFVAGWAFGEAFAAGVRGLTNWYSDLGRFSLARARYTGAVTTRYPTDGFWRRTAGDFGPYGNGYGAIADRVSYSTYHTSITGQALTTQYVAPGASWSAGTWNKYGFWYYRRTTSGTVRYAHHSSYARVAGPRGASSHTYVFRRPPPVRWAWFDPILMPIGASPALRTAPYAMLPRLGGANPYRSPIETTIRGQPGAPLPRNDYIPPEWDYRTWTISNRKPRTPPIDKTQPRKPAPPKAREKERKFTGYGKTALLMAIGNVTEGLDLVSALWKALPKDKRTGYYKLHKVDPKTGEVVQYLQYRHRASFGDKMADVFTNFAFIDMENALNEVVDEAIEDAIYGAAGGGAQAGRAKLHRNTSRDFNEERAKWGRRARELVGRRDYDEFVDLGPMGRSQAPSQRVNHGLEYLTDDFGNPTPSFFGGRGQTYYKSVGGNYYERKAKRRREQNKAARNFNRSG